MMKNLIISYLPKLKMNTQKQPFRGALEKMCSANMQQIYMRTHMSKCNFNKVGKQSVEIALRLGWLGLAKFAAYFQTTFS